MSTGTEGNGLVFAATYPSRTNTYSAGDQVQSAHLNDIQDKAVLTSDQVVTLSAYVGPSRTCTGNQSDSPSPKVIGGGTVWIEATSNAVTEVVLDTSIDWRDRFIVVTGAVDVSTSMDLPGDASDDTTEYDINDTSSPAEGIHWIFYSEQGTTYPTAPTASASAEVSGFDRLHVYVRDDGALVMRMTPYTSAVGRIIAKVDFSPMQDHY